MYCGSNQTTESFQKSQDGIQLKGAFDIFNWTISKMMMRFTKSNNLKGRSSVAQLQFYLENYLIVIELNDPQGKMCQT